MVVTVQTKDRATSLKRWREALMGLQMAKENAGGSKGGFEDMMGGLDI